MSEYSGPLSTNLHKLGPSISLHSLIREECGLANPGFIFFIPYPSAVHHLNGVCHPYNACPFRGKPCRTVYNHCASMSGFSLLLHACFQLSYVIFGSYLMAIAELSLKKTELEETRSKAQRESKMLLDYTRKAIARLTYLKR